MSWSLLRALCVVPVCVLWGCASPPPQAAARDAAIPGLTQKQKDAFAAVSAAYRSILLTDTMTCRSDPCTVPIELEMRPVTFADGSTEIFCIGKLPRTIVFQNTDENNTRDKTILWVLDKSLVPGQNIEFHEQHGILKIGEVPRGNGQFNPDRRIDEVTFRGKNKHNRRGTQATYVPVIIRFVDGLPEVCGTADPRILNT
jgi:hypothetical protein